MSSATHTNNGHARSTDVNVLADPRALAPDAADSPAGSSPLPVPLVFASTVLRHLLVIGPVLRRELAYWHASTEAIGDQQLRATARHALSKRGNIEGAALFATLAPAAHRARTVRALVAYQCAYNYLDALSELPSSAPVANADQLHQALLTALAPDAEHIDYYEHNPQRRDGGYLIAMIDACRSALRSLPSFGAIAPSARAAAARILDFQTLNLPEAHGGHDALERWVKQSAGTTEGLQWWETAAACGSSLAVHALIAAAAQPGMDAGDARAIDRAYHPAATALHSLLDSLVDRREDRAAGRPCLLENYGSQTLAAVRLGSLARRARQGMTRLPDADTHRVILTAMCSYYLSAPQSRTAEAHRVRGELTRALGAPLSAAILLFDSKRMLHELTKRPFS